MTRLSSQSEPYLHALYQELCSILGEPSLRYDALWSVIQKAYHTYPEVYVDAWMEHINKHAHLLDEVRPLIHTQSELKLHHDLLPFVNVDFEPKSARELIAVAQDEYPFFDMKCVESLTFHGDYEDLLTFLLNTTEWCTMTCRYVDISTSSLSEDAWITLCQGSFFETLEHLSLTQCGLTPKVCQALAQCPCLIHLTHLDLSGNPLGDEGLMALAESPYLKGLQHLSINGTGFEFMGGGLEAIHQAPWQLDTLESDPCIHINGVHDPNSF